jgi:hypothetical protein
MTTSRPWADLLHAAPLALVVWFAGLAVITPLTEPTRDVLVFAPPDMIARLPGTGAALMDGGRGWTRVRGMEPGFVQRLYGAGALLVFPAFEGGCSRSIRFRAPGPGAT